MSIDIEKIKKRLIVKYPLFGSVIANLKYVESPTCCSNGVPTAGTDEETVYYHPDLLNRLTTDELTFIFAHEICHVAFDHIARSEGKDPEVWNLATDAVVNAYLQDDGLKMIKGGVDIPDAIYYDAEEMYQKLLGEKQNSKQNHPQEMNEQSSTGESQNKDVGHDTHGMWTEAVQKRRKQEQNQEENGNSKEQEDDKKQKKSSILDRLLKKKNAQEKSMKSEEIDKEKKNNLESKQKIQEQIEKISKLGEKEIFKQNKIERKKQLEELKESLAKQSMHWGDTTNSEVRRVTDIGISEPLIDWRLLLREAVSYNIDWSYQNASIEDGVLTPHLEKFPNPETEILLDTSGSIDEMLLRNFLRECKNILQTSKVKVGCFDTEFYGFQEVKTIYDIDDLVLTGGGGTDFNVAANSFSRRVENKIIFTDGASSMPDKKVDAIWIVFGGTKIHPPGGKVIQISGEQLRKLQYSSGNIVGRSR